MSRAIGHLLVEAAHLQYDEDSSWLEQLVQREVEVVLANEQLTAKRSGDRLVDIGEFLLRATSLLSSVVDGVTRGRHIEAYTKSKIEQMKSENDLSELNPLYDMDEKHRLLTAVAARLQKSLTDMTEIWKGIQSAEALSIPASLSEFRNMSETEPSVTGPFRTPHFRQEESWMNPADKGEPSHRESHSDLLSSVYASGEESENVARGPAQDQASSLSKRGKGRYHCPEWRTCTKGGASGGQPVTFERNSAFRAHIAKHEKPFKCEEKGCNKAFGRPDHLKRHRQKEHGYVME